MIRCSSQVRDHRHNGRSKFSGQWLLFLTVTFIQSGRVDDCFWGFFFTLDVNHILTNGFTTTDSQLSCSTRRDVCVWGGYKCTTIFKFIYKGTSVAVCLNSPFLLESLSV